MTGRLDEAYDAFYKATWSGAWQAPAFYAMACVKAAQGDFDLALSHVERSLVQGAQENDIYYYLGLAERRLGNAQESERCLKKACVGLGEPAGMMYYNDQPPEMIFYQGLAHRALGDEHGALGRFNKLVDYAEQHLQDHVKID